MITATTNLIIAAQRCVDHQGDISHCQALIEQARLLSLRCEFLHIDPLSSDWHSPLEKHHFRSGCGPIEALAAADRLLNQRQADLVVIHGRDYIRSEYSQQQRQQQMAIYPGSSIPEAYNHLAEHFYTQQGWQRSDFIELRDAVFQNLQQTAKARALPKPQPRWFEHLTPLFRGVDCANPITDFEGYLILARPEVARQLTTAFSAVAVSAVATAQICEDGPEHAESIAQYGALQRVIERLQDQLDTTLATLINSQNARLEVYTCYPLVPLAFLLKAGLARTCSELHHWLQHHALTQTGGMNLARGAWNNPALNGLIELFHCLQKDPVGSCGVVQGNGGLGYKQGLTVLTK